MKLEDIKSEDISLNKLEWIIKRLQWSIEDKDWEALKLLKGDLEELLKLRNEEEDGKLKHYLEDFFEGNDFRPN